MKARELQQRLHLRSAQHRLTRPLRRVALPVLAGNGRGLRVEVGESIIRVASRGEHRVERVLLDRLSPGDVVYDLGANIGWYSLLAARAVGPTGAVFAFEPELENAFHAQRNARANGFEHMTVVPAAVTDVDGWLEFQLRGSFEGRLGKIDTQSQKKVMDRPDSHFKGTQLVPALALDSWIAATGQPPPTLVKIDVEGAEVGVLRGMRETLASARPALIVELHATREDVADELDAAGYEHSAIESQGPSREAEWNEHLLAVATPAPVPAQSAS